MCGHLEVVRPACSVCKHYFPLCLHWRYSWLTSDRLDNRACITLHSNRGLFTSTIELHTHIHPTEDTRPWNTGAFKWNLILFPYQVMPLLIFHLTIAHIPQKAITLCQLSNLLLWCWWRMEWIRLSGPKGKQYTLPSTLPWSVLVLI